MSNALIPPGAMNLLCGEIKRTGPNGAHITFPNGWTISIQWGVGTYSDNHHTDFSQYRNVLRSNTAEIAIWDAAENWYEFDTGDTVLGWQTMEQVRDWVFKVANW